MTESLLRVMFVADVVGQPGCDVLYKLLPGLQAEHNVDFTIVNGENANNNGKGITLKIAKRFFAANVDAITGGNHTWENWRNAELFAEEERVLRPANYPEGNIGRGYKIFDLGSGDKLAILNLQGRTFLYPILCPFRYADEVLKQISKETKNIIIDFHAEATAEKIALGWYLDGRVSAIFGTHTHVQTADERVLPRGTAYITDAGMTGSHDSVIGMKRDIAIQRFIYQTPRVFEVANKNLKLSAVIVDIDRNSGKAKKITRLQSS